MSMVVAAFVGLVIYGMIRVLNLASPCLPPSIYSKTCNSEFIQALIASCPILREPYVPPLLWGKSGHAQTIVYARVGRMLIPQLSGERHTKTLEDGSTLTFDLYEPTRNHTAGGQFCILVCPGFGSSSESSYIRSFVNYAQSFGYHVAVLNHLGCVFSLPLTAPRIFSYGGWEEFHTMRQEVERRYPKCQLVLVGLSMGANIVLKYLGENRLHQKNVLCTVSICQGYNINEAKKLLNMWQNMRRAYLYIMTSNQLRLVKHHSHILFTEEVRNKFGLDLNKIFSVTTLEDLDHNFTCKMQGYQDVGDYYERCSCSNFMSNIDIPLIMLNAEDDPIVPESLLKFAKQYAESHDHSALITTKHGGHLGYFENGYIQPDVTSWLDRFACQVIDAVIAFKSRKDVQSTSITSLHLAVKAQGLLAGSPLLQLLPLHAGQLGNKTHGKAASRQKEGTKCVTEGKERISPQRSGTDSSKFLTSRAERSFVDERGESLVGNTQHAGASVAEIRSEHAAVKASSAVEVSTTEEGELDNQAPDKLTYPADSERKKQTSGEGRHIGSLAGSFGNNTNHTHQCQDSGTFKSFGKRPEHSSVGLKGGTSHLLPASSSVDECCMAVLPRDQDSTVTGFQPSNSDMPIVKAFLGVGISPPSHSS